MKPLHFICSVAIAVFLGAIVHAKDTPLLKAKGVWHVDDDGKADKGWQWGLPEGE